MTDNKKPERVGLYADEDSVIIADGAKITGWDTAAKAKNRSTISLKGAITDSKSEIANNNESNTGHKWYQKPIGIVALGVVIGVIVLIIQQYFSPST